MARRKHARNGHGTLKGMAAGAIGGLVGALIMNQAGKATKALTKSWQVERTALEGQQGGEHNYPEKYGQTEQQSEDATQKAAEKVSTTLLHHHLSKKEKKFAGPAVHYLFGAAVGAAYGALAENVPVNKAAGLPFGAAVWLGADEVAVPALHLAEGPAAYPASVHLRALGSHAAYGVTTELVRRGVRALL